MGWLNLCPRDIIHSLGPLTSRLPGRHFLVSKNCSKGKICSPGGYISLYRQSKALLTRRIIAFLDQIFSFRHNFPSSIENTRRERKLSHHLLRNGTKILKNSGNLKNSLFFFLDRIIMIITQLPPGACFNRVSSGYGGEDMY
jgi:hypothetical protein